MRSSIAILLALFGLALAAPGAYADDHPALGTWDVVATTPDGEIPAVMTVALVDGAAQVELELGGIQRSVSDEKLQDDVLTLKVMYEGTLYDIEVKIDGDSIAGTWSGGGNSGPLTAKRRAPATT